ncbi:MAG: SDR family oxidoreductase [Bacilli bacterium]|nr:SDR family oxidoreductase [Bacilli bacterium]MDD4623877.1 SDR family oxidoreductase [Bacilli bacterium]
MKALITGASSGIGRDIAFNLSERGYDLILVSKTMDNKLLKEFKTKVKYISCDLSNINEVYKLYEKTKAEDIDVLVNNAGFGLFGEFYNSSLDKEIEMINLNINAVHILTKLYLKDFRIKNNGYILNVSSSAAFQAGPLMSTYYSTKAYVLRLTTAIYEELRREKSNIGISVLCPGPVDTNFNKVANVKFDLKSVSSKYVADYTIKKMFKKKLIIIPTFYMKTIIILSKVLPIKLLLKATYNIQNKKR